jgi:putative flavoprotein involved in K+ transport
VVVCTGAYQRPFLPPALSGLPQDVGAMSTAEYRNPGDVPLGKVLVLGRWPDWLSTGRGATSGRTRDVPVLRPGTLGAAPPRRHGYRHLAGEDHILRSASVGTAVSGPTDRKPSDYWCPRRTRPALSHVAGPRGPLLGHLAAIDGHRAHFADDLGESVAFGDARWADTRRFLTEQLPTGGLAVPQLPVPAPFRYKPVLEPDLGQLGAVIYATGFRADYRWIDAPVTDQLGFPLTTDGAGTVPAGLYFCGVHFLRTRRSSLLFGVGQDAALVAHQIASRRFS